MVAASGFQHPLDTVSSPDGRTFYFTGFTLDEEPLAAIFRVDSAGGTPEALHAGAPLAFPTGLVLSCDGSTLYVADQRTDDEESDLGALYSLATAGGTLTPLPATGIGVPSSLAMGPDCASLSATGTTTDGLQAVFTLPAAGGAAAVLHSGEPFVALTGIHVDPENVRWVMDHLGGDDPGREGVLWAVRPDGSVTQVIDALGMGSPGGVSTDAMGRTAVMPVLDRDGDAELVAVDIASGRASRVALPSIVGPAGLRSARDAAVFAIADAEGGAIYRAE
jgi:sugar lactone lactonase YvrE